MGGPKVSFHTLPKKPIDINGLDESVKLGTGHRLYTWLTPFRVYSGDYARKRTFFLARF